MESTQNLLDKQDEIIVDVSNLEMQPMKSMMRETDDYTKGLPDPDLIIRTGGDCRLSNFLLWQSAYSELIFIKASITGSGERSTFLPEAVVLIVRFDISVVESVPQFDTVSPFVIL